MKIGIGLPATIPGIEGSLIAEWAVKAEELHFSSLGVVDRLVYPNHEPMISLAAAATSTERILLMTTVLLGPLRNHVILAKQAATLQSISAGRFNLGLGIGIREDDFKAAGVEYSGRGTRLEYQINVMRAIWSGDTDTLGHREVGPPLVKAPKILMGAFVDNALKRVGRIADGYLAGPDGPAEVERKFSLVNESWVKAQKTGKPRLVGGIYYALGDLDRGKKYMRHYYDFILDETDWSIESMMVEDSKSVKNLITDFESIGMDELIFHPCVPDIDEINRLADIVS